MFNWKILDIKADEKGMITDAHYFVSAQDGSKTIETEGNWKFLEPEIVIPFSQVTEQNVIDWIKNDTTQDGQNTVESGLLKQLKSLAVEEVPMPWKPQVFTIKL